MLQSEVGHVIAQAVEKVIVAVVLRSEQRVGLCDQVLVVFPNLGGSVERGRAVGGNVHFHRRRLSRIERNDLSDILR